MLKFNDGVEFNTDGPLRIEEKYDGLYVVGKGMLIPINTREEGENMITLMTNKIKEV